MGLNTKILFAFSLVTNKILTSSHYTNYTLEDDKVCPVMPGPPKELSVGKDNRSAIIIKDTQYFKNWFGRWDFECRFIVKTKDRMGLFAVIQKMSFRRDIENDACIDYVQFRSVPKKKHIFSLFHREERENNKWSKKYCGQLHQYESIVKDEPPPTSQVAFNAYISKEGEIEVQIHVSNRKLERNFSIEIEMAFTSYMDCSVAPSTYKTCGDGYCIHKDYFSDNVVNCPFISCKDEPNCPKFVYDPTEFEKGLDTKVYVTAVTSIFLSFFLFLGCIMLCRYFDMLCWSEAAPQDHHRAGTELEQVSPTAPPPESPDKDLPPAYETLFPER
ncbi:unnamed protein product [Nezara viridula]|uniref:Uncharacterized protein n=1 Tax=Nezara viridula TaxID=85310 RepID=A0A9P0HN19_NEZVI|nr:unnamed protein product [Nezara viridula]